MKTVDALYEMYARGGTFSSAMLVDLFGFLNAPEDEERIQILDGIYQGLYRMNVPSKVIEQHRRANTLDQLIHQSYRTRSSGYYERFCKKGIVIGPTNRL